MNDLEIMGNAIKKINNDNKDSLSYINFAFAYNDDGTKDFSIDPPEITEGDKDYVKDGSDYLYTMSGSDSITMGKGSLSNKNGALLNFASTKKNKTIWSFTGVRNIIDDDIKSGTTFTLSFDIKMDMKLLDDNDKSLIYSLSMENCKILKNNFNSSVLDTAVNVNKRVYIVFSPTNVSTNARWLTKFMSNGPSSIIPALSIILENLSLKEGDHYGEDYVKPSNTNKTNPPFLGLNFSNGTKEQSTNPEDYTWIRIIGDSSNSSEGISYSDFLEEQEIISELNLMEKKLESLSEQ